MSQLPVLDNYITYKDYAQIKLVRPLLDIMSVYYIKQGKLHLSPFDQAFQDLSPVSAERDKFTVEIPVARLNLP